MNTIELRNIRSLLGKNFFIPDYQRGYRWTKVEVEKLLNDFKKFYTRCSNSQAQTGEFYCLQPVVVKPKDWQDKEGNDISGYEVIDGQQRLTTLYLLFKSLTWDKILDDYPQIGTSYSVYYQSRTDSQEFLEDIENKGPDEALSFIDFYHMKMVFDTINKWLKDNGERSEMIKLLFRESFQNNSDIAHNVRVIWYEIDQNENSVDIFTRLNIGKIPLTNAELIKALLLRKSNFSNNSTNVKDMLLTQFHIAEEWNQIEQKLQDNAFWYFIYNSSNPVDYETRIEYIFDLMMSKYATNDDEDEDFYYTFEKFNKTFEDNGNNQQAVEFVWNSVKDFFSIIESWYSDRKLFHLIGYLIETGVNISKLLEKSKRMSKTDFLKFVKRLIKFQLRKVNLEKIEYKDSKMKNVLLLFNVLTVLESDRSDLMFSFDKYKNESWDKEHIASQHNKEFPNESNKRIAWLNDMIFYFVGARGDDKQLIKETIKAISLLISQPNRSRVQNAELLIICFLYYVKTRSLNNKMTSDEKKHFDTDFNNLYQLVLSYFTETNIPDNEKDKISNMALLNYSINRSYGDAFFPVKRSIIKENDMTGVFVPIATKNVFMKFYSKRIDNMMYWTRDDAASYLSAIKQMLSEYITQ